MGTPPEEEHPTEQNPHLSVWDRGLTGAIKGFFARHGRKLWWLHSLYALALGVFVATFANKGFFHARWLTLMVSAAWLVSLLLFRLFGSGREQRVETRSQKLRFLVMTYVLKNLYQGMLFFLLPFYWRSTTVDGPTLYFSLLLSLFTLLATLDVVFDRVLMRWRALGSAYYVFALFACLNLALPALFPFPPATCLLLAAAVGVLAFLSLHVPLRTFLSPKPAAVLGLAMVAALLTVWVLRKSIPPVPLHLASAAVGPEVLPDGRLALEVNALHHDWMKQMKAVTDVATPARLAEDLVHVWRHRDREVLRLTPTLQVREADDGDVLRLSSELTGERLPKDKVGEWTVDVETSAGQLVGRFRFTVR